MGEERYKRMCVDATTAQRVSPVCVYMGWRVYGQVGQGLFLPSQTQDPRNGSLGAYHHPAGSAAPQVIYVVVALGKQRTHVRNSS